MCMNDEPTFGRLEQRLIEAQRDAQQATKKAQDLKTEEDRRVQEARRLLTAPHLKESAQLVTEFIAKLRELRIKPDVLLRMEIVYIYGDGGRSGRFVKKVKVRDRNTVRCWNLGGAIGVFYYLSEDGAHIVDEETYLPRSKWGGSNTYPSKRVRRVPNTPSIQDVVRSLPDTDSAWSWSTGDHTEQLHIRLEDAMVHYLKKVTTKRS